MIYLIFLKIKIMYKFPTETFFIILSFCNVSSFINLKKTSKFLKNECYILAIKYSILDFYLHCLFKKYFKNNKYVSNFNY